MILIMLKVGRNDYINENKSLHCFIWLFKLDTSIHKYCLLNCPPSDMTFRPSNSRSTVSLSVHHWRTLFPVSSIVVFASSISSHIESICNNGLKHDTRKECWRCLNGMTREQYNAWHKHLVKVGQSL